MKLLTTNTKLDKNISKGWKSYGIHLSPANKSGYNVCQWASEGCTAACLDTSGMGNFSNVQTARINKTKFFFEERSAFLTQLKRETNNAIKLAARKGEKVSFRYNLTSDLPWEKIKLDGKTMMEHFPEIQFMDYTKSLARMKAFLAAGKPVLSWGASLANASKKFPHNYHLTYSRSEVSTKEELLSVLNDGGNVAVVFRNKLPKFYLGYEVVNGDETDLRFLDGEAKVVGLAEKGLAKKDESGFVVEP